MTVLTADTALLDLGGRCLHIVLLPGQNLGVKPRLGRPLNFVTSAQALGELPLPLELGSCGAGELGVKFPEPAPTWLPLLGGGRRARSPTFSASRAVGELDLPASRGCCAAAATGATAARRRRGGLGRRRHVSPGPAGLGPRREVTVFI